MYDLYQYASGGVPVKVGTAQIVHIARDGEPGNTPKRTIHGRGVGSYNAEEMTCDVVVVCCVRISSEHKEKTYEYPYVNAEGNTGPETLGMLGGEDEHIWDRYSMLPSGVSIDRDPKVGHPSYPRHITATTVGAESVEGHANEEDGGVDVAGLVIHPKNFFRRHFTVFFTSIERNYHPIRGVNTETLQKLIASMRERQYLWSYGVITVTEILDGEDSRIGDSQPGSSISPMDADVRLTVVDGRHRCLAIAKLYEEFCSTGDPSLLWVVHPLRVCLVTRQDGKKLNPLEIVHISVDSNIASAIVYKSQSLVDVLRSLLRFAKRFEETFGCNVVQANMSVVTKHVLNSQLLRGSSDSTIRRYVKMLRMFWQVPALLEDLAQYNGEDEEWEVDHDAGNIDKLPQLSAIFQETSSHFDETQLEVIDVDVQPRRTDPGGGSRKENHPTGIKVRGRGSAGGEARRIRLSHFVGLSLEGLPQKSDVRLLLSATHDALLKGGPGMDFNGPLFYEVGCALLNKIYEVYCKMPPGQSWGSFLDSDDPSNKTPKKRSLRDRFFHIMGLLKYRKTDHRRDFLRFHNGRVVHFMKVLVKKYNPPSPPPADASTDDVRALSSRNTAVPATRVTRSQRTRDDVRPSLPVKVTPAEGLLDISERLARGKRRMGKMRKMVVESDSDTSEHNSPVLENVPQPDDEEDVAAGMDGGEREEQVDTGQESVEKGGRDMGKIIETGRPRRETVILHPEDDRCGNEGNGRSTSHAVVERPHEDVVEVGEVIRPAPTRAPAQRDREKLLAKRPPRGSASHSAETSPPRKVARTASRTTTTSLSRLSCYRISVQEAKDMGVISHGFDDSLPKRYPRNARNAKGTVYRGAVHPDYEDLFTTALYMRAMGKKDDSGVTCSNMSVHLRTAGLPPDHRAGCFLSLDDMSAMPGCVWKRGARMSVIGRGPDRVLSEFDKVGEVVLSAVGESYFKARNVELTTQGYTLLGGFLLPVKEEGGKGEGAGERFFPKTKLVKFSKFLHASFGQERYWSRIINEGGQGQDHTDMEEGKARWSSTKEFQAEYLEENDEHIWAAEMKASIDMFCGIVGRYLELNSEPGTVWAPRTGSRILRNDPDVSAECTHNDFPIAKGDRNASPGYFSVCTLCEGTFLLVTPGSHKYVHYSEERRVKLRDSAVLEEVYIPPFSIFFANGYLQHAGSAGTGISSVIIHMYFIPEGMFLPNSVTFGLLGSIESLESRHPVALRQLESAEKARERQNVNTDTDLPRAEETGSVEGTGIQGVHAPCTSASREGLMLDSDAPDSRECPWEEQDSNSDAGDIPDIPDM